MRIIKKIAALVLTGALMVGLSGHTLAALDIKPAIAGTGNMLKNGGFETLTADGGVEDWSPMSKGWAGNDHVAVDTEIVHSGKNSVRLKYEFGSYSWRSQFCQHFPVESYAEYQLTLWVRIEKAELNMANMKARFVFYRGEEEREADEMTYDGVYSQGISCSKPDTWEQKVLTFTAPPGVRSMSLYLKAMKGGLIWVDDCELTQIKEASKFTLTTDSVFYYPDQENGVAKAKLTENGAEITNGMVDFTLRDGKKVLAKQIGTPMAEGIACFRYKTSLLAEKKKAYYVDATLKTANGSVVQSLSNDIYVYDRPKLLLDNEQGFYEENGKTVIPTFGYWGSTNLPESKERGVNMIETGFGLIAFYNDTNGDEMQAKLDEIAANGQRAFVSLYGFMRHPSDPMNVESVKKAINRFKNHPAVYAWSQIDEPFDNYTDPLEGLKESYKLIRDLDDEHPVFLMVNDDRYYTEGIKYCDIFGHDPYPGAPIENAEYGVHVQTRTEAAYAFTRMVKKPLQTTNNIVRYADYTPTPTDERNMWYQALLGGSDMNGYYSIEEGFAYKELDAGVVEFAKDELDFSYTLFAKDAPVFNEKKNKGFAYRISIVDGKPYLLVLNRSNETQNAVMPLCSKNGKATLADGVFSTMYGCEGKYPTIDTAANTMTVELSPRQTAIWSIEGVSVDSAALLEPAFSDLGQYVWASTQIESLFRDGIVNDKGEGTYAPGEAITRGDFAMFLINALGINYTEERREAGFADVSTDDPYYDALCIGKTFNIFKGVGDNKFMPDKSISRQDVMVICARGLRYVYRLGGDATTDLLTAFTDAATISDYAAPFVAQMVKDEFVKGNADGTVNPLGDMTRAEAAVLMERVLSSIQ